MRKTKQAIILRDSTPEFFNYGLFFFLSVVYPILKELRLCYESVSFFRRS